MEAARLYDMQTNLATAARDGARLAAMDRDEMELNGFSINDKITADVRNFLNSVGLPGDDANVLITSAEDPDLPIDLDDPAYDLELFRLRVELPYSSINPICPGGDGGFLMASQVVFRNAQAAIVQ